MTKDEALKLALEALEKGVDGQTSIEMDEAITSIKEAIREHAMYEVQRLGQEIEQEPAAMLERDPSIGRLRVTYEDAVTELDEGIYPLYTKPQRWRDNVAQAYLKGFDDGCKSMSARNGYTTGRWSGKVENASKPVAWLEPEWRETICPEVGYEVTMTDDHPRDLCWIPLYATPPTAQRTWVGLTDEERIALFEEHGHRTGALVGAVEAKLKEKNT